MFMIKRINVIGAGVIFLLSTIFIVYIIDLGDNILDPGDGLKHFLISKYAWQYPNLFFDHWGKPLFTLLSSPFAQFGFKGMVFFNLLLFVITGFLILKISKILSLKNGWLAVLFCFSAPIYFSIVLSGLTEILFATLVVSALYFFLKEQYFWGCLVLSFSYFSRPESIFVIMWFVTYLVFIKKYKYIPILGISVILYSLAGYFYYNDILWVFTKRPYSSTGTYGSGDVFHFITSYKHTFGSVISFLFLSGSLLISINFMKKKFVNIEKDLKWILLVLIPIISVVGVHSILWWKGLQGSAGLLRILATIAPLVALIALYSLDVGQKIIMKKASAIKVKYISGLLFFVGIILAGYTASNLFIDARMISSEEVLRDAASWYKKNNKGIKIYYMPPYFSYAAEINPFGEDSNMEMFKKFKDKKTPSNNMKNEELVLWEGQFSKIEGKISLEMMFSDPNLLLLKTFSPKKEFMVYGEKYGVYIFKKVKNKQEFEINTVINRIKKNKEWFSKVRGQAKDREITIDEMLIISAKYVLKNRNR